MKYNSDDSDAESDKLPVASSPEDDFSTPLRKNITLTPSTLTYKMTESEPSKSSLKSRIGDLTKTFAKQTAKKSSVLFESQYSPEREAEIEEERKKAAVDFPNPIDDTLQGLSLTTIEQNETWYDIPSKIDSDKNKELATKERIRANVLKGQRRAFYTTITKMKNRIMRDNETTNPQEWRDIQAKCRGTFTSLTHITDELKHYGFQNSPQEIKSYTKYFSDLKTMLNKIDNIVDAEHDDELREAFLTTYLKEEDAFSKGISVDDLADDFNQTLGAEANSTQFKWKADPQAAAADDDENLYDNLFKDSRKKQPEDSDEDEETFRENPGASKSFYSEPQFNRHQGTYTPNAIFPPNLNNPTPNQENPGGHGGPGGQPPMPPGGGPPPHYNWGAPPPNMQQQQQQQWAGYPPQGYPHPYHYGFQPPPNYQGIRKIQCEKFDGREETYKRFKLTFASAYVKNRNLPESDLALILVDSLKGDPLTLIQKYLNNCTTDLSYKKIWKLLEERYGGQNVEDSHVINAFKSAPPLKDSSMRELERILDVISVQYEYYKKYDPASLQAERSLLFQTAKEKLNPEFSMKFVRHTTKNNFIPNLISLKKFLKAEFLVAQTTEREYKHCRLSKNESPNPSSSKLDKEQYDEQNKLSQKSVNHNDEFKKEEFSFFIQHNRSGHIFSVNDFRKFQDFGSQSYGNPSYQPQQETQRAIVGLQTGGELKGGQPKPQTPASQWKEGQCSCCRANHTLDNCPKFKTLAPNLQSAIIRRDKICFHCLLNPHYARDCKTDKNKICGIDGCDRYHHTILHRDPNAFNHVQQIDDECKPKPPTEAELNEVQNLI